MARGRLREAERPPAGQAPPEARRRTRPGAGAGAEQARGPAPATGEVRLALGRLLYERDDLDGAER